MTNSNLMLAALTAGLADDGTTSAALDAIREESGCTLLAAVLEVARVWNSARANAELREAAGLLADKGPFGEALKQAIAAECPNISPGAYLTIVPEAGDMWPRAIDTSLFADGDWVRAFHVSVGARWIKREASRLQVEQDRDVKPTRKRRSR